MLQKTPDVSLLSSSCSTSSAGNALCPSWDDLLESSRTHRTLLKRPTRAQSHWKALQKAVGKFQQQLCDLVRGLLLSSLDTLILLSGLNTCVEFAPVAMVSAKCSAEITSVGVYTRIANLKILFLWGREINILSKCWKWDSTLHVSKQNLSDKVIVTVILSALLQFISISGTWYSG